MMPQDLNELEQRMLQLSATEKARLALFLLESLEPADAGDLDDTWRIEAEARLAEVENGESHTVPADEVFENISRRLP